MADMATSGSFVPFTNGDQDVLETIFSAHKPMPKMPANQHGKALACPGRCF